MEEGFDHDYDTGMGKDTWNPIAVARIRYTFPVSDEEAMRAENQKFSGSGKKLNTPFNHSGMADLLSSMFCVICHEDVMVEPVQLRCGHVFCYSCIYNHKVVSKLISFFKFSKILFIIFLKIHLFFCALYVGLSV